MQVGNNYQPNYSGFAPGTPPPPKKSRAVPILLLSLLLAAVVLGGICGYLYLSKPDTASIKPSYEILAASSNVLYGTVEGSGVYEEGQAVQLSATACDGCVFVQWDDGVTQPRRTVAANDNRTFTAVFHGPEQEAAADQLPSDAIVTEEYQIYDVLLDRLVTDKDEAPEGYVLTDHRVTERTTDAIQYVPNWPAGFDTAHELYTRYQMPEDPDLSRAEHVGYIYWHWCHGDYTEGPINRTTDLFKDNRHDTFHAYYSTERPDISGDWIFDGRKIVNPTPDGTYHHPHSCCSDTYWFYVIDVMQLPAESVSEHTYTFELWSGPTDTVPEDAEYRATTMYRYRLP